MTSSQNSRRHILRAWTAALAAAAACGVSSVHAQADYPRKPIRLVIPYPAGAGVDTLGRQLAEQLGQRLGQPVIVDNRGGANGAIGMEYVAKAPPDGYTLVLALDAQFAINPNLFKSLPYDPVKDFTPIMLIGTVPYVLFTNPKSGIKSVSDLVDRARRSKEPINYTSSGIGSGGHMASALLESMAKINMTHVPNKSTPTSLRDVAENECQFLFVTYAPGKPMVDAGKLIPIAVTGARRTAVLPDVPTVAEAIPGFEMGSSYGLFATAGTPQRIIEKLNAEVMEIVRSSAYQQRIAALGIDAADLGPQAFSAQIKKELDKWRDIVKERGITAN